MSIHAPEAGFRVLILGGTAEARSLATILAAEHHVAVVSSLAGRVSNPALPAGEVRIGGFGGPMGLRDWLVDNRISALVDATHPFAATITASAMLAAEAAAVPLLGLRRPSWTQVDGRPWRRVASVSEAARLLSSGALDPRRRVFLTTGRRDLTEFADLLDFWFLARSVDPPAVRLPPQIEVVLARGPYTLAGELELMRSHEIEVLVTKDSGGTLTQAKLAAAAQLDLEVIVVDRPNYPVTDVVDSPEAAAGWVRSLV